MSPKIFGVSSTTKNTAESSSFFEWADVRDRIYSEAGLYKEWKILSPTCDYTVVQTKTNGCVSYGVSAGIEDTLDLAQQKGKWSELFHSCAPWLYGGYHNLIKGCPSTGGCSSPALTNCVFCDIINFDRQLRFVPHHFRDTSMATPEFSVLSQSIIDGDLSTAMEEVQRFLAEKTSPQVIMEEHLIKAMGEVGRLFEEGEYFVPELMISARAMQEAMKVLNPLLAGSGIKKIGRVVIGTVKGDFHDIGKNLVAAMLEGGGFEVLDLGVDVSPEQFAEAAQQQSGTVVAMSALLTTTMPQMQRVIEKLESDGLRRTSKVMIGGAPVTDEFAKKIGADGYSSNASAAVTLAKSFFG